MYLADIGKAMGCSKFKFKYQLKGVQGDFPNKYGPKTLKTPMVNLSKNVRPFRKYIFKIQWEINFLTCLNTDRNAQKKFRTVIV